VPNNISLYTVAAGPLYRADRGVSSLYSHDRGTSLPPPLWLGGGGVTLPCFDSEYCIAVIHKGVTAIQNMYIKRPGRRSLASSIHSRGLCYRNICPKLPTPFRAGGLDPGCGIDVVRVCLCLNMPQLRGGTQRFDYGDTSILGPL
jgi:hypothetical protein